MADAALRDRVAVVGVGNTTFGRLPGHSAYDLGLWAFKEALADAGLRARDVDGLIVNRIPDYQRFGEIAGIDPRFAAITPGQGRMSGASIQMAAAVIAAGMATTVALVYGNDGRSAGAKYGGDSDGYGSGGAGMWFPYGMTSPGAVHAMMFRQHMHRYGTTTRQLAEVGVAFRTHASLNPNAVMREPITIEQHQASRFICDPLRLFDYCLINDGGVCLIVTGAERARDRAKPPVWVRGFGQATRLADSSFPDEDFWHAPIAASGRDAFAMAGVAREDLDALMIYDNFSPTVLFSLEGLGFCGRGESGPFVEGGTLSLGGRWPTNTSGGHMSESYMQGWALNVEAVRQLRGECGPRQVNGARHVLYTCAAPLVTTIIYGRDDR
jgi:acetyl-CoA acetyltransferase